MLQNNKTKKVITFFLALLLMVPVLSTNVVKGASEAKAADSDSNAIINQVYGGGSAGDGAVSHGFIELYNPTDEDVDLSTYSIQYSRGKENSNPDLDGPFEWSVLNLTGKTIKAHHSFLILCDSGVPVIADGTPRYTIYDYDIRWEQEISNRSFHVALVSNQTTLSPTITASESQYVIDLIGAKNTGKNDVVYNYEGSPLEGISKQKSARRKRFQDTNENSQDFEITDYRLPEDKGLSDEELEGVKPRYSGDGEWGTDIVPEEPVTEDQKLVFSKEAGLYQTAFNLTMTTGYANGIIRYTTDGSEPTADSNAYTTAISIKDRTSEQEVLAKHTNIACSIPNHYHVFNINYTPPTSRIFKGNVIKARVFSEDGKALTGVYTKSYFVNASYGNLPVISLVTDERNFFDGNTGLYVNDNYFNKGSEWERPIHFEMFEPNGATAVSQNMGVRINGGVTRNLSQKSLRLYAKSGYDAKNPTVEYDLFDGRAKKADGSVLTTFRRFLLRNSGNDNTASMMRDAMMQSLVHDTDAMIQAYRQSVVFLNGEFWGIYNIRERIDDESILRKYDIDDVDNIGMLEFVHNDAHPNTPDEYDASILEMKADYDAYMEMWNWFESKSSLTSADYLKAQTFIDMNNFIDYYILNTFVNNTDWPGNNNQMWRYRTNYPTVSQITDNNWQDGRWRWMLKDTDSGFGLYSGDASTNSLTRLTQNTDYSNRPWSTLFFRKLITNAEFKDQFVNRYCDLMNTNFKKEVVISKITTMSENISSTIEDHISRWRSISNIHSWNNHINTMKTFADGRVSGMRSHLKTFFSIPDSTETLSLVTDKSKGYLTLNGMPITTETDGVTDPSSWSGTYFINKTQTISATPYEGYRFDKFIVGTREYSEDTIKVTLTDATTVQAIFAKEDGTPSIVTMALPKGTVNVAYSQTLAAVGTSSITWSVANGTLPNGLSLGADGTIFGIPTVTGTFSFTVKAVNNAGSETKVLNIVIQAEPITPSITVTAGVGGSVMGGGTFESGDTVTLTAVADEGYTFEGWYENGVKVHGGSVYTFTAESDRTLEARFTINRYNVTANAGVGGGITGGGTFEHGKTVTLTATPQTGYYFVKWLEGAKQISTNQTYSFTADKSQILVAEFAKLSIPSSIKMKSKDYQRLTISWEKVANAVKYEIYRANSKNGIYEKVTTTAKTSYTDTKRVTGKTYYYKLCAVYTIEGKMVNSVYSEIFNGKTKLSSVTGLKVKKRNSTSSKLNWKRSAGASGYEIYRANKQKGKYKKAGDTKRITYKNIRLTKKCIYWYRVRAYRLVNGKKVYGQFSKIQKIKI